FGHKSGAFTGADRDRVGLFEAASGGTLFLDEIGELPLDVQVKLLRVLQEGEVRRLGENAARPIDVRIVAATNRDLEEEVANGGFREDLLYRLNVITLELPALAERPDDVLPLFYHFLGQTCAQTERPVPKVTPELEQVLQGYGWPGNVRELENEAKRLLAVCVEGQPLTVDRLSQRILRAAEKEKTAPASLAEQERRLVEQHLRLAGGNRTRTAKSLGISREGLRKKMKRLGIA
ncbi:MAG: sigma 54-interacting transcriptional regulator, partial [Acidobacteriota bacterium]